MTDKNNLDPEIIKKLLDILTSKDHFEKKLIGTMSEHQKELGNKLHGKSLIDVRKDETMMLDWMQFVTLSSQLTTYFINDLSKKYDKAKQQNKILKEQIQTLSEALDIKDELVNAAEDIIQPKEDKDEHK